MSLTHAVKWSFLSELAAKAIQPVVFVILARLLSPEDFGVMSAALMVIGFSQIFWEAGMSKAVIQRQTEIEVAANAAFWINIGLGVVVVSLLFIAAGNIADIFFRDERVTSVIQVMTIQVFLGSVSAIHIALLQKDMDFKKLFWVRFATVSLPGLASIPLAWYGMGYWALVAGTLVGQVVQVAMLWRVSTWRPTWSFDVKIAREIGRFGAWVAVSGLLAWFYIWADSLVVGMYLGSHDLGLYRTGNQFAIMIFAILFSPLVPVLYSHLSMMKQDKERMRAAAAKVIKVLTFVAVPIAMIVFSLAGPIGETLFGKKWDGIGFVIGVMALTHGFAWVVGMNGEVYRAMGKPSYETIVPAFTLPIYLAAYIYSIRYGFESLVWTRFALALGGVVLQLLLIRQLLGMRVLPIARYALTITVGCGVLVFLVQFFSSMSVSSPHWQLLGGGTLDLLVVAGFLFLIERNGILKELTSMVRRHSA